MAEKDDKTEKPTAKRVEETRNEGNVAKSTDLSSAFMLLAGSVLIWMLGDRMGEGLRKVTIESLLSISNFEAIPESLHYHLGQGMFGLFLLLGPFLAVLMVLGLAVNVMQIGLLWSWKAIGFKFNKIYKLQGLKKIFSSQGLVELVKSIAKMIIVGVVAYMVISSHFEEYLLLADVSIGAISEFIFSVSLEIFLKCALVLIVLGFFDLMYVRFKHEKDMRMSKQEVKDEARASDGDPKIKGKIRQMRLQMRKNFMMKEVPKATVVITNPTFIAIAVRYEQGVDVAPVIIAKGKRLIAEKIRDAARANSIPIVEDKPLARSLFDVAEIGEPIPAEFFAAVAEILAYVYGLQKRGAA